MNSLRRARGGSAGRVRGRRREAEDHGGGIGDPVLDSLLFFDGAPPATLHARFARDDVRELLLDVLHGNPGSSLQDGALTLVLDRALSEADLRWIPDLVSLGQLPDGARAVAQNRAGQAVEPLPARRV